MGKGTIVEHLGKGKYTLKLDVGKAVRDERVAKLDARIAVLDVEIDELQTQLDDVQAQVDVLVDGLDVLIAALSASARIDASPLLLNWDTKVQDVEAQAQASAEEMLKIETVVVDALSDLSDLTGVTVTVKTSADLTQQKKAAAR